ncbi:MAG: tRNA 2-thiouridine(34) synthase MnmA [Dialister sp.]|nr:tRNA 2-thiouridine(34) synthase MnmA [Dialister sp.]
MVHKKKVVVAMSGGVDSTLTAKLLMEHGYDVCGATMRQFDRQNEELSGASAMAEHLGIPFVVIDVRDIYHKTVLSYFIDSYAKGITPNPCMMCDFKVKFGIFYDEARKHFGASYFSTGHYARILYNSDRGKYEVHKGIDLSKDQSYMMYHLTQDQLAHIVFPLGRVFKKDTRRISKEKGLPTFNKPDSQDICFLTNEKTYVDYLKEEAPWIFKEGRITDLKGRTLGTHRGIPYYTIGQRKGLGISSKEALYVIAIDPQKNEVIVGNNEALFRKRLLAAELHFTDEEAPADRFACEAKIRYGIRTHAAQVMLQKDGRAVVEFDEPQRAITAGQSVVFYDGDRLIGGGTILRPL